MYLNDSHQLDTYTMKPQSLIYVFQIWEEYTRLKKKKQYFVVSYNHHRKNYFDSTVTSKLCTLSWYIYLLYYWFLKLVQSAVNCFNFTKGKSCSQQWPPILWTSSVIIITNEKKILLPYLTKPKTQSSLSKKV